METSNGNKWKPPKWKPQCASTKEWINCYIHIMEYLVAMRTIDHATLCVKSHKHDAEQEKSDMKEHLCMYVYILIVYFQSTKKKKKQAKLICGDRPQDSGHLCEGEQIGVSGVLLMFCFSGWVIRTRVFSLLTKSNHHASDVGYVHFCICYTLV